MFFITGVIVFREKHGSGMLIIFGKLMRSMYLKARICGERYTFLLSHY